MGRTPKPGRILVTSEEVYQSKEVQGLAAKGHHVICTPLEYDLILGPECCAMDLTLVKYVNLAVKRMWERMAGRKVGHGVEDTEGVKKAGRADVKGVAGEGVGDGDGEDAEGGAE